jgi:hypothetical protein
MKMLALSPLTIWTIRILGLCIFAAAFFLSAVATSPHDPNPVVGWECAKIALKLPFAHEDPVDLDLILVTLSGWLNPFLLIYLILTFFKKLQMLRWLLVALIFISMLSTWTFFFRAHYTPLIGHYLWILGALIVLSPELFSRKD